jgi:hypothetical protein
VRFHRLFSAALAAVAVTLTARSAATQTDPARSTDGNGGAPTPQKNQSTGIAVSFDASAAALPQDDIRAAIARELSHQPGDGTAVTGTLEIAVEDNHIVARFRSPQGYTERVLPLPEEHAQISVMLGLLAGNLARDQLPAVRPEPPPPAAVVEPTVTPVRDRPPPPREKPTPPYARHYLGLHVAQDLMVVSGMNACDPNAGQFADNFACFYAGTEEPFYHVPDPGTDNINGTWSVATTRLLFSYDYALATRLTLGLRAGYAFRGGPPAGKSPTFDGSGGSTGGTAFMPWHLEVRAAYWFTPLSKRTAWHGFLGIGLGLAQVDAMVHHEVVDCELFAGDLNTEAGMLRYQECRDGAHSAEPKNVKLDAWKKTGQAFAAARGGAMLSLTDSLAANFELSVLAMFPAPGVSFEPSVGMVLTP